MPFAIRLVRANLAGHSWNLERAAANLGARPWQVFCHVTLPLIRPGVVGAMIFAFVLSFDEVVLSLFLAGPDAITLPVRIFGYLDQSPGPIVLAAGSILVLFAIVLMLLLEWTVRIGRAFGVEQS
ncbi:MAG: ABC transporter permease subunit [Pseudomonadota bacterium]